MNVRNLVWVLGLCSCMLGCRQNINPSIPLSPIGAMGGTTRVPPPGTGSYSVPGGYYQGQAAAPPNPSLDTTSRFASSEPVGSGASADESASMPTPSLPLWTDSSPRYTSTVQPAGYAASSNEFITSTSGDMRPALRGMQVVDLTQRNNLQPTTPPTLNSISPTPSPSTTSTAWESLPSSTPSTQPEVPSTTPSTSLQWRRPEQ